jgi:hypothetical protein
VNLDPIKYTASKLDATKLATKNQWSGLSQFFMTYYQTDEKAQILEQLFMLIWFKIK